MISPQVAQQMLANESVAKKFNLQQLIASQFEKADDDFIDAFVKEMSENENTKKSTEYQKNYFENWATHRSEKRPLCPYFKLSLGPAFG